MVNGEIMTFRGKFSKENLQAMSQDEIDKLMNDSWGFYNYMIMQVNFRKLSTDQMRKIYLITQESIREKVT